MSYGPRQSGITRPEPDGDPPMDNKTALFLAAVIAGVFLVDQFYLGWDLHMIIAHRLAELIEKMAVWR